MKNQVLFSLKDRSKKSKCCLLQFLCGSLRVKYSFWDGSGFIEYLPAPVYSGELLFAFFHNRMVL